MDHQIHVVHHELILTMVSFIFYIMSIFIYFINNIHVLDLYIII